MAGQMSRHQQIRAVLVLAGNLVFFGLFVVVIGLTIMKFLAVSGTPHPETFRYHVTAFGLYFVATTIIAVVWRVFQAKSGQSELLSQSEASVHEEPKGGGE